MHIPNWKSWRLCVLLACLLAVAGAILVVTNDTVWFVCKLHFGSEKMKTDCLNKLADAEQSMGSVKERQEAKTRLPPEWTWRYLISDHNPMTRIMVAKTLWYLHPTEDKWLSVLVTETDNSDADIRSAALGEFWNMDECFTTTAPILRKHLFEDKDELPRRSACTALLPLSNLHPEARNILDSAAQDLRYESTKDFVKRWLESWDERHKR